MIKYNAHPNLRTVPVFLGEPVTIEMATVMGMIATHTTNARSHNISTWNKIGNHPMRIYMNVVGT